MEFTGDELAGVVDLFGALTREELREALAELAYKAEGEFEPAAFEETIEKALDEYRLVEIDAETVAAEVSPIENDPVLVPGPGAFPMLPEEAGDLRHMLDIGERSIDRATAGEAALGRFREDAASAVEADEPDRVAHLLDVSYELEAWADVDLGPERDHLDSLS